MFLHENFTDSWWKFNFYYIYYIYIWVLCIYIYIERERCQTMQNTHIYKWMGFENVTANNKKVLKIIIYVQHQMASTSIQAPIHSKKIDFCLVLYSYPTKQTNFFFKTKGILIGLVQHRNLLIIILVFHEFVVFFQPIWTR